VKLALDAVLLDARRAQARESMLVDRRLPAQEFFDCERIALAGFLKAQQPSSHGRHDFCFAADDPAPRRGRRKVGDRQRASVGAYNIFDPRSMGIGHDTLTQNRPTRMSSSPAKLMICIDDAEILLDGVKK